jgi:hypothetical protein
MEMACLGGRGYLGSKKVLGYWVGIFFLGIGGSWLVMEKGAAFMCENIHLPDCTVISA